VTGSDVSHVTGRGPDRKLPRSMFCAWPVFPRAFFNITVVQVPWLHVTEGRDPFGVLLGLRMHNRKLRNICPSGVF
jgi:hypothetical protein